MHILCLGSALADITTWPVDHQLLAHQHLCPKKTLIGPGGCAGNLALGLAALGQKVMLAVRLGTDPLAHLIGGQFQQRGIDLALCQQDPEQSTGVTLVLVDDQGERRFVYTAGANAELDPKPFLKHDFSSYRIVHIGDLFLLKKMLGQDLVAILRRAREAGCLTSMDTVWDPSGRWLTALEPYLKFLDFLFVSEEESQHIFPGLNREATVAAFRERGSRVVVLKCGQDGCLVGFEDQLLKVPSIKVRPVDSTGAGDCFVAGFLAAVLEGKDLAEAAGIATLFAVKSLSFLGATSGLGHFQNTAAFMNTQGNL